MMNSRSLGANIDLAQIIEYHGPTHDSHYMLPDLERSVLDANASWLYPNYWAPRTNRLIFTVQLWILKMSDAIILVDAGCGNQKSRQSPYQNMTNNPVIEWLEAIGAPPEKVTHVVHTHLHADHVGWNTRLVDGRWVPTFPNAIYYMPKLDYELFKFQRARTMGPDRYDRPMADSVIPILDAGLTRFVKDGDEIASLVATAAPGHTPGSTIYTLRNNGDETIFAGDVIHSPIQVLFPEINTRWCEDQSVARITRHRLLRSAAARNAVIYPAHAKDMTGWRVGTKGDRFSIGFE